MNSKKPLVLNISDLTVKVENFYHQMNTSNIYRETFLHDPVRTLSKDLFGKTFGERSIQLSKANRLLFILLSNKKFIEWTKSFEKDIKSKINNTVTDKDPTKAQLKLAAHINQTYYYRKIVQAMFECLDVETFEELLEQPNQIPISLKPNIQSIEDLTLSEDSPIAAVVVAVVAVAVAAIAVAVAYIMEASQMISRTDLWRISNVMIKELTQEVNSHQQEGKLKINLPNQNMTFDSRKPSYLSRSLSNHQKSNKS